VGKYIIGLGAHSGSKWLASTLHNPELGICFYHERRGLWTGVTGTRDQILDGSADFSIPPLNGYVDSVHELLETYEVVGDFSPWPPYAFPSMNEVLPIDKVIVILRHGIRYLYSCTSHSAWRLRDHDHWGIDKHLRKLWEITGSEGKPWDRRTLWEKKCAMWPASLGIVEWLRSEGFTVVAERLEDLVSDTAILSNMISEVSSSLNFSDDELRVIQENDINRKVPGDRRVATLWDRWTEAQQATFIEICGDGMEKYGYDYK